MHGVADYDYAALFAAAPELVGFDDEEAAVNLSRIVGGEVLLASLLAGLLTEQKEMDSD